MSDNLLTLRSKEQPVVGDKVVIIRDGVEVIRLDDYLFKTWQHPRKTDVLAKHVGDFRKWKAPAAYKTALKRLVRDLEAEPAAGGLTTTE